MSLAASIRPSDDLAIKWMKLQRMVREAVDGFGISYSLGGYLTDIRPGDTEGLKWAKLGAWVELLAGGGGSGPGGTGDVTGPASATDGRPALFDGATGKLLKEAGAALGTAAFQNTGAFDAAGAAAAAQSASQPLDSDLTAIAALTTTAYGRAFLALADAAAARTAAGVVIGTDVLAPNGSGASLTALNATNLASGTIPDARFPATLPAASGTNLTALNPTNLATGSGAVTIAAAVNTNLNLTVSGTGVVKFSNGTLNLPAIATVASQNAGFYSTNAGIMSLSSGNKDNWTGAAAEFKWSSDIVAGWASGASVSTGLSVAFSRLGTSSLALGSGSAGSFAADLKLRNLTPTGGNGLAVFTVATLPATAATGLFTGSRVYVTDSNAASYTAGIGAVVAAGGSTIVPVFYNGTNWLIG